MKLSKCREALGLLLALTLLAALALPAIAVAAQPTVGLGTASTYAVLAGETITNTGATTVGGSAGGDLGLFPGSSFPGLSLVTRSGSVHLADTAASQAKDALVTAYNDAAGRTPETAIPSQLGGQTLVPGVYVPEEGADFNLTGTLTLDAQGDPDAVFIFKTTGTLITASGSTVSLVNGPRPCRVFWKVGSSATLGTNSLFVGHIFALTSISAQTGASIQGQLLARNGSVTLDHNTITNGLCVIGPAIHVSKTASPTSLTSGSGPVTFTYFVTNPGTIAVSNVTVSDNKLKPVTFVSGDTNGDKLLQPSEIWVYTGRATVRSTTTNVATASGNASGTVVTDTASRQVVVSTVAGGELPNTATPWDGLLLAGVVLAIIGAFGWWMAVKQTNG
jgi:type VI secretion system secreted protein VgrG